MMHVVAPMTQITGISSVSNCCACSHNVLASEAKV